MALTFNTDVTINGSKVLKADTINVPTSSGGSTYGPGTSGQVLKTNGTTVYWDDDDAGTAITDTQIDALFT